MTQPSLPGFESAPEAVKFTEDGVIGAKLARAADYNTSHEAGEEVEQTIERQLSLVIQAFRAFRHGATNGEAKDWLAANTKIPPHKCYTMVHKRNSTLREMGLIEKEPVGERKYEGRNQKVWRAV